MAVAIALTKAVVAIMPDFYVPNEARITVNEYVLAFSAAVSIATGILFGLVPALQCSRPDLVEDLKGTGKGSSDSSAGGRTRGALVIVEVALSVVLLVGASLTIRGFVNLQRVELGFNPDHTVMVERSSESEEIRDLRSENQSDARGFGACEDAARSHGRGDRRRGISVWRVALDLRDRRQARGRFAVPVRIDGE